jgi:hypothetical protein
MAHVGFAPPPRMIAVSMGNYRTWDATPGVNVKIPGWAIEAMIGKLDEGQSFINKTNFLT